MPSSWSPPKKERSKPDSKKLVNLKTLPRSTAVILTDLNQLPNLELAALLKPQQAETLKRALQRTPRPMHPCPLAEAEISSLEQGEAAQLLKRLAPSAQNRLLQTIHNLR